MVSIVDKRGKLDRSSEDRSRFIRRYKDRLKQQVDESASKRSIKDIDKENVKVKLSPKDISEPNITFDYDESNPISVGTGNTDYNKGDKIPKPRRQDAGGPGNTGEGEDDFMFTLSKEEFMDIYFSDMSLPNFIKNSITLDTDKYKWRKAGYIKEGIPSRLNLIKSFINAKVRKKISKKEKEPFLIDNDLRYDHLIKNPEPQRKAAMFCLLDTSFSMNETRKDLAKRFFTLLYLFLTKNYETVTVHFIRHTQYAEEVDEETFFRSRMSGGTVLVSAMELAKNIIDEEYDLNETNIYISQASDGEDFEPQTSTDFLVNELLPIVQYYIYIEVREHSNINTVLSAWKKIAESTNNFAAALIRNRKAIYPALKTLFKEK